MEQDLSNDGGISKGASDVENSKIEQDSSNDGKTSVRGQFLRRTKLTLCHDISKFDSVVKIGQGTYGEVYKARDSQSDRHVAMKRVMPTIGNQGFPTTTIREIKILHQLKHANIVELIEVCRAKSIKSKSLKSTFFLIFEFCDHDLAGLLANKSAVFKMAEIKMIMKQLLEGLFFIHNNKILHRDLKPANILLTKAGVVKLADFGLARAVSDRNQGRLTNRVVTLWYRSPELLLGDRSYGQYVDMWSVGCIMAEMFIKYPILRGATEQNQLLQIVQLCGSITEENWKSVRSLPYYDNIILPKDLKRKVTAKFRPFIRDAHGCNLLERLLSLDPSKRIDCNDALDHDFFWTDPMPVSLQNMMLQYKQSMFQYVSQSAEVEKLKNSHLSRNRTTSTDSGYQDIIF